MAGILEGIRVVDLSRYIAGPFCGQLLADMGAEVIKVEKPGEGDISRTVGPWKDGVSLFFQTCNVNKKSITADMRTPEGLELVKKLIAKSDILLENFRVGVMAKMGLTYDEVKKINPRIIMVSVTGFGQTGPMKDRIAFDGIISSMSGVTRIENGEIQRSKGAIHDHIAAMYAAMGVVLALYDRTRTGKGQYVDVAMLAASSVIRSDSIAEAYLSGEDAAMSGDDSAPYGYLKAKDGFINYHAGTNPFYHNLIKELDDPILHKECYYNSIEERLKNRKEIEDVIRAWAADKTCDELDEIFQRIGVPSGIVNTPGRLLNQPQLRANGFIMNVPVAGLEKYGPVPFVGFPFKLSEHPDIEYRPAPTVGEHTEEIYKSVLDMSDSELEALRTKGVI